MQQFASSEYGALTMSLIREFLTFFNMQYTLAVFDPESCEDISYKNISRSNLAAEFGLEKFNSEEPLLHSLIKSIIKDKHLANPSEAKSDKLAVKNTTEKVENLKGKKILSCIKNT